MSLRRSALRAAAIVAALAAAGVYLAWSWLLRELETPYRSSPTGETIFVVEPGTPASTVLGQLEAAGVVADARLARGYLELVLDGRPIRAGEYRFDVPLTLPEVLDRVTRGDVLLHRFTLVEGLTLDEAARSLAEQGFGRESVFRALFEDPSPISHLAPAAVDLEGYLFPDTYHVPRGTTERDIVATAVGTFERRFQDEITPLLAPDGPRPHEIVTLASIVEEEARVEEERPVIAGVYRNRLDAGIALYADPTVIYGLKLLGRWEGRLTRDDLAVDSPYNTYRLAGLPPGPICSPGLASLVAAARPAEVPYFYFVARNDGTHAFARTLAEHNRNVAHWRRVTRRASTDGPD